MTNIINCLNTVGSTLFFPLNSNLKATKANGKIDCNFNQNSVNDCGLIASLYSISQTKEGAQAIEDSLVIIKDAEGDNLEYNITFKGTGETYIITEEELEKSKIPDENGRQYATGDDDVTIYELALEKCFKETGDETLKNILKNYTNKSNSTDILNGVNPSAVIYSILGETSDTIRTYKPTIESIEGKSLYADKTFLATDVNGNTVEFKEGQQYKPYKADKNTLWIKDMQNNEEIVISRKEYANNVFIPNNESAAKHASDILDNFEQNPLTNVLTFGATGKCTIEGVFGNTYELNNAHAYSITSIEDDNIIFTNASRMDNQRYIVSKDSLLTLEDYWIFGTEKEDSIEAKMEDIADKDGAVYYPNILSLIMDKLFG